MGEVIRSRSTAPSDRRDVADDPLLAELRGDYSSWHLIAEDARIVRFWGSELGVRIDKLAKAGLIRIGTEAHAGRWLRRDVWVIARTEAERAGHDRAEKAP